MELIVTGCKDCKLYNDGQRYEFAHFCNHPNSPQEVNTFTAEPKIELTSKVLKSKIGELEYEYSEITPTTPDWCPLDSEPITIKKQKQQ